METLEALSVTRTLKSRLPEVNFDNLEFGNVFSDHMLDAEAVNGVWTSAAVRAYGSISIAPSLSALHYGQAVFEGLKAFRTAEGEIQIFRPDKNYERLVRSCERLSMTAPTRELFFEGLKTLVDLDRNWVPKQKFKALYIRPFVFASDPVIRLQSSHKYRFMIITSPVGNYYKEGFNPVALKTMPEFVRAVVGGIGEAKAAGNYAASLKAARMVQSQGFTQVLWLDAKQSLFVEEVGTMNIFFVIDGVLVTPKLTGSILPGVTRDSVLFLARQWGMPVQEREVTITELVDSYKRGGLTEAFGAGTAAVISPVGLINHDGYDLVLGKKIGPVARQFYDAITGIQYGELPDPNNWCFPV